MPFKKLLTNNFILQKCDHYEALKLNYQKRDMHELKLKILLSDLILVTC